MSVEGRIVSTRREWMLIEYTGEQVETGAIAGKRSV
jgi:hypothetical protein